MNKIFFSLIIFCVFYSFAKAQDTIVKVGGSKIICKIEREDSTNVYFKNEVNGKVVKTFLQKTDILTLHYYNANSSKTMSDYELFRKKKTPDIASLGIGFGLDYGGVGANLMAYPQKNIGLFLGAGYNFAEFGFHGGVKLRIMPTKGLKISPFTYAMYGYNAVIIVKNASQLNKVFYGPSIGLGIDTRLVSYGYCSLALIIPIRDSEVSKYLDDLNKNPNIKIANKLSPVGFSIGYRFIID